MHLNALFGLIISLRQLSINPLSKDLRMIQGTPAATGASGVTGVQQGALNSAGQPCSWSAGAPASAGGQKSASVSTLLPPYFWMNE